MSAERTIESTGENVEEAIAKGLAELGAAPTDVIVEVLDEPSRGVFGIGARPARVRLKLFRAPAQAAETPAPPVPRSAPPSPKPRADKPVEEQVAVEGDEDDAIPLLGEMKDYPDERDVDEDARVAKVVLTILLEKMSIRITEIHIKRAVSPEGGPWLLDINGPNLNPLIGRRGETLAALQYITRLIASRELQHRANIVVDAAGYKSRRSRMLRDLAIRMADQAVQSKRTVALEPMPPYERRIIHLTLRNRSDVQTKSVGEGAGRKVTIIPK